MAFSINTNIASMQAQEYLRQSSEFQGKTINRVTSGLRIVNAGDDAAGLAIANSFRSDQAVLSQGIRNANDGLATLQTIDGGIANIGKLLDRARSLAAQSASGTFTGSRSVLNSEFQSVLGEIDRQAQAIGLDKNGAFARELKVFIGGGRGSSDAGVISNGLVSVDLTSSAVDTRSLGLDSYRAAGKEGTDIGGSSATSVKNILSRAENTSSVAVAGFTKFSFKGAGFSDGVEISVDYASVKDTESLVSAINTAIAQKASSSAPADKAFTAAGITAKVVTDNSGRQQLAFDSNSTVFQVSGEDQVALAFMGQFADPLLGVGRSEKPEVVAGQDFQVPTANIADVDLTINVGGSDYTVQFDINAGDDMATVIAAINTQLAAAGTDDAIEDKFQAYAAGNRIAIRNIQPDDAGTATVNENELNFKVTMSKAGTGFAAGTAFESAIVKSTNSGGAVQSMRYSDNEAYKYTGLTGTDTQDLTFSVMKQDGSQVNFKLTLDSTNGATLDSAVDFINDTLQASSDKDLMKIVAVKEQNGNGTSVDTYGLRFMSSGDFSLKIGTVGAGKGVEDKSTGAVAQGVMLRAEEAAGGGKTDIASQGAAQDAVSALLKAVTALGEAQAVVGRGQNQFNYAVSLAATQLTNLAASESRIRDADLAQEAANLTKAQLLQQAGIAALAQANSAPQAVLSLLRG